MVDSVSIYVHVPFCAKKCPYCHFYSILINAANATTFAGGVLKEWQQWIPLLRGWQVETIYFGGGTPSLLGAASISSILDAITKVSSTADSMEITLEANPESVSYDLMKDFKQAGINRVSIGIQSFEDTLLKGLNRSHSAAKGIHSIEATARAGFDNISIDLMFDLPRQDIEMWTSTLATAMTLPIVHLSLYNLTIEPHSLFHKKRHQLQKLLPTNEESTTMLTKAQKMLALEGFVQYEISAFAKNHRYSKHNTGYWTGRPFIGLGPSAFSYWQGKRFHNIANLSSYCRALKQGSSPIDFEEILDDNARKRELFVIGLRLIDGLDITAFEPFEATTAEVIADLQDRKLLIKEGNNIKLSAQGILFYDTIAAELI